MGTIDLVAGEYDIPLTPTGALELAFVEDQGGPVGGVDVTLQPDLSAEPPLGEGDLREDPRLLWEEVAWKRTSGSNGACLWPELAPGWEYVWSVLSAHVPDEDIPSRAARQIEPAGRALKVTTREEVGGTGSRRRPVTIQPGGTTRERIVLLGVGTVSGTILGQCAVPPTAVVKLFDRRDVQSSSARLVTYDLEADSQSDAGGRFLFKGVRPGQKRVAAYWQEDGLRFNFVYVEFTLKRTEHKELGVLTPAAGHTLEGLASIAGEAVPREFLASGPKAIVNFSNNPPPPSKAHQVITEIIRVPIGEPFWLVGLMQGRVDFDADLDISVPLPRNVKWENPRSIKAPVPAPGRVDLIFKAVATLTGSVRVKLPAGGAADDISIYLLPGSGGELVQGSSIRANEFDGQGDATARFIAPAGEYAVWAVSSAGLSAANYFGQVPVTLRVGEDPRISITLGEGAHVRGRAVGVDGAPYVGGISFQVEPYTRSKHLAVYRCGTDAQGRFLLKGVAPQAVLKPALFQGSVRSGPAGSETATELRRVR